MAKILVVDDAAFMRMMLKNILGKNGHQIVGEAQNGAEGVKKYQELKPDVVTMDIIMPELNGIEAVRKIIALDPEAKIVMVSALGQEAMVKEALEAGARDFIVKPFKENKVLEVIEKLC
ncbi:MAG: response regulator [Euryarchaeota archaeon]|nr:response regulator [Euryarchaeota archaeon]